MLLELFFQNPMLAFTWLSALIIALTIHEFSHAAVGKWRGDDTAEKMGRLSLNPLAHLDPLGLLMLVTLGFGWARPVPYDPRNLGGSKWDDVMIALAGPASNVVLAGIGGIIFRLAESGGAINGTMLAPFLVFFVLTNVMLAVFNMIPIYPLDGSKLLTVLLARTPWAGVSEWFFRHGNQLLLVAILISIMTPFDPFFFVQVPAFNACSTLVGSSCIGLLGMYLGG